MTVDDTAASESVKQRRLKFNAKKTGDAVSLAEAIGITTESINSPAERFAHFEDDDRLVIVAGDQEGRHVELALARGLGLRGDRELVLVLPATHSNATMQRVPWLADHAVPTVYLHDGAKLVSKRPVKRRTQGAAVSKLIERLGGVTPEADFTKAITPKYLGKRAAGLMELVERATTDARLDPGHRQSVRSWHCRGRMVLSLRGVTGGLDVTAGIHDTPLDAPNRLPLPAGSPVDKSTLDAVWADVETGIAARLTGAHRRRDEAWLQSVIRDDPSLVGVEQPALREVPAWRPHDTATKDWGRGLIDLVGLDGQGDIRLVETKLSTNKDELLVLQGLDYYVWAHAYRKVLGARLGAPSRAELEIHYVIGTDASGEPHVTPHAKVQVANLDPAIRWRFHVVDDWFRSKADAGNVTSKMCGVGETP